MSSDSQKSQAVGESCYKNDRLNCEMAKISCSGENQPDLELKYGAEMLLIGRHCHSLPCHSQQNRPSTTYYKNKSYLFLVEEGRRDRTSLVSDGWGAGDREVTPIRLKTAGSTALIAARHVLLQGTYCYKALPILT